MLKSSTWDSMEAIFVLESTVLLLLCEWINDSRMGEIKGKMVKSLVGLNKHKHIKRLQESGAHCTRCKWIFNFTLRPLYPRNKTSGTIE